MNNKPLNKLGSIESIDADGVDDISIIKFMVDHNCFEENKKLNDFQIFTKSKDNPAIKVRRSNTPEDFKEEVKDMLRDKASKHQLQRQNNYIIDIVKANDSKLD